MKTLVSVLIVAALAASGLVVGYLVGGGGGQKGAIVGMYVGAVGGVAGAVAVLARMKWLRAGRRRVAFLGPVVGLTVVFVFEFAPTLQNVQLPMVSVVETGGGQHLTGDVRGPYVDGVDHANTFYNTSRKGPRNYVLYATASGLKRTYVRSLSYDYTSPAGGGAVDRGVILNDHIGRVRVYPHSGVMSDIPVGASVAAGRVEILQSWTGPEGTRYCLVFSSRNTSGGFTGADGTGSTDAIITRVARVKWTILAPRGSIGRLWQLDSKRRPEVDLGYYHFTFSITATEK